MISVDSFRKIALSFPKVTEEPHFEKTSFRVNKKIFATLDIEKSQAVLKLTENDQYIYSAFDCSIVFPVPDKWGLQGWTIVKIKNVKKKMLTEMLAKAYSEVAPKKFQLLKKDIKSV